jgi:hypothetical protein
VDHATTIRETSDVSLVTMISDMEVSIIEEIVFVKDGIRWSSML